MKIEYMQEALKQANVALQIDEVPIGAVIVYQDEIIARGFNLRETKQQAIAHAEIMCIEKACEKIGSWRLNECSLYVTLEPCPMCAGAIIQSRIKNVYFGAYDPKGGCFGSVLQMQDIQKFNHHPEVTGGIMEEECAKILKDFFQQKRLNK